MIDLYAGTTNPTTFTITDADGDAVDLTSHDAIVRIDDFDTEFTVVGDATGVGTADIIVPDDTHGLYHYWVLVDDEVSEEGIANIRRTMENPETVS